MHKKPGKEGNGIAQTAIDLLQKGRKGILIFRPGVKEIEDTAEELQQLLRANNIRDVEVAQIYRGMPADERRRACLPPAPGHRKILIGTNIIESGMNLRWVDSGITDGMGKIPYDREDTGASALVLEELPQWRIKQQQGRINRDPATTGFERGVFVHCTRKEMQTRPLQGAPELERCSLTSFAFHAAALGYQPEELHLDAQVTPERWQQAHQDLIRLGLVDEDWKLTKDGEYAKRLPVSPETAAVLCEARRMDIAALRSDDNKLKTVPNCFRKRSSLPPLWSRRACAKIIAKGTGLKGSPIRTVELICWME